MTTEAPRRARRAQSSAAADRAIVEGLVAQARFSSLPTPEDLARMAGITLYRAVRAIQAAQHEVEAALAAPTASPATRRQRSSARRSAAAAAAAASEEAPASEAEDAAPAATPAEAPASGRAFRTLPEALSPLPRRRAPGADGRDRCRAAGPPQPSLKPFASVPADRLSEVPGEARWRLVRARFDREVGKIRYNSHLLDAYEGEGWAGLNTEKLVPRAELASARVRAAAPLCPCVPVGGDLTLPASRARAGEDPAQQERRPRPPPLPGGAAGGPAEAALRRGRHRRQPHLLLRLRRGRGRGPEGGHRALRRAGLRPRLPPAVPGSADRGRGRARGRRRLDVPPMRCAPTTAPLCSSLTLCFLQPARATASSG